MNKATIFFGKLFLFAVMLVLVDLLCGVVFNSWFHKQRSGKYFTTSYALQSSNEDVIILGNSHASEHFNASLMQQRLGASTFNLGNEGQTLFYFYPLVKSVLARHTPKLIIVELDYNELRYQAYDYQKLSIFLPYYHTNAVVDSAVAMMGPNERYKANSALYRFNSTLGYTLLNIFHPGHGETKENRGFAPVQGNLCDASKTLLNEEKKELYAQKEVLNPEKVHCLINLINAVRNAHCQLLVVTTPFYFYTSADDMLERHLKLLLNQMKVNYLDDGTNSDYVLKCQLFHDEYHLNAQGANKWTNHLVDYIKEKHLIK